jgi:hypothetical protein
MPEAVAEEWPERLWKTADESARVRTNESELRADLNGVLQPYALDVLGLRITDIRQEGTGTAGRYDSMFGQVIIEYKRPNLLDSPAECEAAARQAIGYLEDASLAAQFVIVTDGKTWAFLRDPEAGPEPGEQAWFVFEEPAALSPAQRFAWRDNSVETASRVLSILETVKAVPVTSWSVVTRLGLDRPEAITLVSELASCLQQSAPDSRADVLFRQWIQLAGVAYGIGDASAPFPSRAAQPAAWLLGDRLAAVLEPVGFAGSIFVLHTYVSIASKLLACELLSLVSAQQESRPSQWVALDHIAFVERIRDLEQGKLTDELNAPSLLAGDLFGWYAPLLQSEPRLERALRGIIASLAELAWARVANAGGVAIDLLRDLYQAVVPRRVRKALGEFFTPRYLAERVLTKAVELADATVPVRLLDPSCGSGTFLVAALRSELSRLAAEGRAEDPAALYEVLNNLIGFDINPVAPLMTKVNLLLALGDLAQQLPEIQFHVYQADSILLPTPLVGALTLQGPHFAAEVLQLEIGDVILPAALASLEGVGLLRQHIESGIATQRTPENFARRLRPDVRRIVAADDVTSVVNGAVAMYEQMLELDAQGRNGIWSRVVEQSFAPRALRPVDIVVGNPPWISWKDLPTRWKDRSEQTWRRWGMWQRAGRSVPLSDISSLLLARSIATYCPTGLVALLLPQSVLIADPGGRRIRRTVLQPDAGDASALGDDEARFLPLHVDDFSGLNPFSPDASNLPIALYVRAGALAPEDLTFPMDVWSRATPGARLQASEPWRKVEGATLRADVVTAGPVDPSTLSSPWVRRAGAADLRLLPEGSPRHYRWGRGFETRGVDGLLFLEVVSPAPAAGLIRVRTRPDLGTNTAALSPTTAAVEPAFIWPLIKGEHVQTWRVVESGLYCIVAHDPDNFSSVLSVDEMIERSPRLFDLLDPHLAMLRGRSLFRRRSDPDRPWGLSGPAQHLDPDANLVMVRYIASGGRPAAAVRTPRFDRKLGRTTIDLPNNKTNIIFTSTENEAWYLCGWVNSQQAQDALERTAAATGITPRALERLPIPRYDPSNSAHLALAAAAKRCEGAAEQDDDLTVQEYARDVDAHVSAIVSEVEAST